MVPLLYLFKTFTLVIKELEAEEFNLHPPEDQHPIYIQEEHPLSKDDPVDSGLVQ